RPARRTVLTLESLEARDNPSALAPGPFDHAPGNVAPALVRTAAEAPNLHLTVAGSQATPRVAGLFAPFFGAKPVSSTQVNISWAAVTGASGYLVDEWINGAWHQIGNFGSSGRTDTVTGLRPGTTYYFDVCAYNGSGITWGHVEGFTTARAASTVSGSL